MPISLAELENDRATAQIVYRSHTLNVTFNPSAVTGQLLKEANAQTQAESEAAGLALTLSRVLVSWDLMDDGAMYPLTPEALAKVPTALLWAIFFGMQESLKAAKDERKN